MIFLKKAAHIMKRFVLKLIQIYTHGLKYILVIEGCRYQPTCSSYMRETILYNGLRKGLQMGIKRILRCHPWVSPEKPLFDPVEIIEKGKK